jgi:hypothetical protein
MPTCKYTSLTKRLKMGHGWIWLNLCPLAELVVKCAKSLGSVTGELFSFQIFKIIYTSACHLVRIGMNEVQTKVIRISSQMKEIPCYPKTTSLAETTI